MSQPPPDSQQVIRVAVSSTPRATLLWASTTAERDALRRLLDQWGRPWSPAGEDQPLATSIDIGVDAWDTCERLRAHHVTFDWHPDVPIENREGSWASIIMNHEG